MNEGGPERYLKGGLVLFRHAKECGTPFLPFGPTFFHHATYVPIWFYPLAKSVLNTAEINH